PYTTLFRSVHAAQHHVQHDGAITAGAGSSEAGRTVVYAGEGEAFGGQPGTQQFAEFLIVVEHQYRLVQFSHSLRLRRPPSCASIQPSSRLPATVAPPTMNHLRCCSC